MLSMSTGNVSLATCKTPCSTFSQFIAAETGSVQYANIGTGMSKFQADSAFRFAVIDPSKNLRFFGDCPEKVALTGNLQ